MPATAKDIKNYLNHLSELKNTTEKPISLEIEDDNLYHLIDGHGQRFLSCTKEIYNIFQEL